MTAQVQTVAQISSVGSLKNTLKSGFSTYPVVDNNGSLVGIISSRFIKILILKKCWTGQAQLTFSQRRSARKQPKFSSPQGNLVSSKIEESSQWEESSDESRGSSLSDSRNSCSNFQSKNISLKLERRNSNPNISMTSGTYNIQSYRRMQNFTWEQEPQLVDKQLVWRDFKLT